MSSINPYKGLSFDALINKIKQLDQDLLLAEAALGRLVYETNTNKRSMSSLQSSSNVSTLDPTIETIIKNPNCDNVFEIVSKLTKEIPYLNYKLSPNDNKVHFTYRYKSILNNKNEVNFNLSISLNSEKGNDWVLTFVIENNIYGDFILPISTKLSSDNLEDIVLEFTSIIKLVTYYGNDVIQNRNTLCYKLRDYVRTECPTIENDCLKKVKKILSDMSIVLFSGLSLEIDTYDKHVLITISWDADPKYNYLRSIVIPKDVNGNCYINGDVVREEKLKEALLEKLHVIEHYKIQDDLKRIKSKETK